MIMSKAAFEIFQYVSYAWFCVGVVAVGFLAIRDLIKMILRKK